MVLGYQDIISGKRWTVPMPWIALADAAAAYQAASQADEHECFGEDWFDEDGNWPECHFWHEPAEVLRRLRVISMPCDPD